MQKLTATTPGDGAVAFASMQAATQGTVAHDAVEACLPRLHRFALMISPPGVEPDDLVQEACLRAIERAGQFDPRRGTLDAWLWRIVVNLARDSRRFVRRSELLVDRLNFWSRHGAVDASPEALALDRLQDEQLTAAVRRLPRRYRSLIALRYGADLPIAEVARCMGLTRMATAKALRRSLDRLRADLLATEVDREQVL
jgi:RNA polymerase sigma-70 factor (ECF subfamily)